MQTTFSGDDKMAWTLILSSTEEKESDVLRQLFMKLPGSLLDLEFRQVRSSVCVGTDLKVCWSYGKNGKGS